MSVPVRLSSIDLVATLNESFFSVPLHDSISSSLIGVTPRLDNLRRLHRPMRKNAKVLRSNAIDPRTIERTMVRVLGSPIESCMMGDCVGCAS